MDNNLSEKINSASLQRQEYCKTNKAVIFFLFLWMFRLLFLMQGNVGGVQINKYVLIQIFAGLCLFFILLAKNFNFSQIFFKQPISFFAIIFFMGICSIAWGILPLMGCYFAFENLIMLATVYYLASQTKDFYQLERYYLFANLLILWAFIAKCILFGGGYFHSVAYSTVAGYLLVYSVGEYGDKDHPPENSRMLRWGVFWGILGLVLTTSAGAIVSVCVAMFVLVIYAKSPMLKFFALLAITILLVAYFSGSIEWVLSILFPGKTMASISTAHGRTVIWNMIFEKAAERPLLGWGYASVERILPLYCTDAHNAVIGVIGSLGYIGGGILVLGMLSLFFYCLSNRYMKGMRGILAAAICGLVNSNTSNFISAQAGLETVSFLMILVMAVYCKKFHKESIDTAPLFSEKKKKKENVKGSTHVESVSE